MDAPVVIVGAGPAGALLGFLLSSRGIDTLLLERQSDFSREFRGELLMPSGLRALESAGIDLDSVSHCTPQRVQAILNGHRFLDLDTSILESPRPTAVSQPELLEALVSRANATGHFELRRGTTLRRIEHDGDGMTSLHLRGEAQDGEDLLRTRVGVGADGRGSICRRSTDPTIQNRSLPLDVVWFKMPYPSSWTQPQARFEMGRGHLLIVVQAADGLLQMAWIIVKGSYGELKSRSHAQWIDARAPHTDDELREHLESHRDQITRPFLLNAVADCVLGWSSPGMLLIGDAAHTMSPVGGQGLNLALRDAILAANELVPALRAGRDIDAAAARVEALRRPEIDQIQRLASLPPRIVMGRTPLHELARRTIAHLAGTRLGRSRGGRVMSLFLDGVQPVELLV